MSKLIRIQVRVSEELHQGLAELSKRYGSSVSAICSSIIGKHVYMELKALDMLSPELIQQLLTQTIEEKK